MVRDVAREPHRYGLAGVEMSDADHLTVTALWDDAGVWDAESEDVPGLVTEAATTERLVAKLQATIPELLEVNGGF